MLLETTVSSDPLTFFLNFGTLGVVFILLLTGMLYTKPYVQRLEKECLEKDELLKLLSNTIQGHTLPALASTARVLEAVPSSEAAMVEELRRLRGLIEGFASEKQAPS